MNSANGPDELPPESDIDASAALPPEVACAVETVPVLPVPLPDSNSYVILEAATIKHKAVWFPSAPAGLPSPGLQCHGRVKLAERIRLIRLIKAASTAPQGNGNGSGNGTGNTGTVSTAQATSGGSAAEASMSLSGGSSSGPFAEFINDTSEDVQLGEEEQVNPLQLFASLFRSNFEVHFTNDASFAEEGDAFETLRVINAGPLQFAVC
ncbi:hypothetical protein HKX48_006762 [Thoreauomyces humboldtii]|nr:hypothetical protein HKX48_006762 [Thoreauomyces humboldtii]